MVSALKSASAASITGACAASLWLAACAAPVRAGEGPAVEVRVLVKLVRAAGDGLAIGAEATRRAGVPVTYASAAGSSWHALALHCVDAAQCEAAIGRLRSAASVYEAVEIEGRQRALGG